MASEAMRYSSTTTVFPGERSPILHFALLYEQVIGNAHYLLVAGSGRILGTIFKVFVKSRNDYAHPHIDCPPEIASGNLRLLEFTDHHTAVGFTDTHVYELIIDESLPDIHFRPLSDLSMMLTPANQVIVSCLRIGSSSTRVLIADAQRHHTLVDIVDKTNEVTVKHGEFDPPTELFRHLGWYGGAPLFLSCAPPDPAVILHIWDYAKKKLEQIDNFGETARCGPYLAPFTILGGRVIYLSIAGEHDEAEEFDLVTGQWSPFQLRCGERRIGALKEIGAGEVLVLTSGERKVHISTFFGNVPSLREMATRAIHASLPAETAMRLHASRVENTFHLQWYIHTNPP